MLFAIGIFKEACFMLRNLSVIICMLCSFPALSQSTDWTVLFYCSAEMYGGYNPLDDFASGMRSSDCLEVIAIVDTETEPTFVYHIPEDGIPVLLEEPGELNMGDGETLSYFIAYGKDAYPADRYFLAMYGSGQGWEGVCLDYTSGNDLLEMEELRLAVESEGGIDLLAMTAPNYMGAVESAYQLRNCVDAYIASSEVSGYIIWMGIFDEIADVLNNSDEMTTIEVGESVVEIVEGNTAPPPYEDWFGLSCIDQSKLEDMTVSLNQTLLFLIDHMDEIGSTLEGIREETWEYGMGGYFETPAVDLHDFLELLLFANIAPSLNAMITETMDHWPEMVVNEFHGSSQKGANGLSIIFPEEVAESLMDDYSNCGLAFAENTEWVNFITAYFGWLSSGIEGSGSCEGLLLTPGSNPFTWTVSIGYAGMVSGLVSITIHDTAGRLVHCSQEFCTADATGVFTWNGTDPSGRDLPSGIYTVSAADESGNIGRVRLVKT